MKTGCVAFLPERRYRWSMSVLLLLAWATAASAAIVDVEVVSDRKGSLPLYRAGSAGLGDTYRAYVEAEKGELYGIRIRNNTGRRIGVVVAVDGRNIVSGEKSTLRKTERMYILGPHESADYDGWRTARDTVNRFYFTDPGDSYAGAFGDHSAMGVVAVAVYREKEPPSFPRFSQREREPMGQEDGSGAREPGPMGAEESARGELALPEGDHRLPVYPEPVLGRRRRRIRPVSARQAREKGRIDGGTQENAVAPRHRPRPGDRRFRRSPTGRRVVGNPVLPVELAFRVRYDASSPARFRAVRTRGKAGEGREEPDGFRPRHVPDAVRRCLQRARPGEAADVFRSRRPPVRGVRGFLEGPLRRGDLRGHPRGDIRRLRGDVVRAAAVRPLRRLRDRPRHPEDSRRRRGGWRRARGVPGPGHDVGHRPGQGGPRRRGPLFLPAVRRLRRSPGGHSHGIERALSSTDRAPDFGSGGWGVESPRARQSFPASRYGIRTGGGADGAGTPL